jgi:hypothetical protein
MGKWSEYFEEGRIPIFRVGVTAESGGGDIEVQIANTRY